MKSLVSTHYPFSLDTVLLLLTFGLMIASDLWVDWLTPFVLPLLALYVLLDLLAYGRAHKLFRFSLNAKLSFSLKLAIIWLLIALFLLLPAFSSIILRHTTAPHLYVQDGLMQTEEAIKFLLNGQNPYVEDYVDTAMADWNFKIAELTLNPALYHLVYLPATFTVPVPFYLIVKSFLGWYDHRLFQLVAILVLLVLLPTLASLPERRLSLLLVVGLNPLFAPFFVMGRNDVLVLLWLVATTLLLRRRQYVGSAITLGLACSTKHTAWFFAPFYMIYLLSEMTSIAQARVVLRRAMPAALVVAAFIVPFLVWNPQAFLDDTWRYLSGGTASAFPIAGVGFGTLLLKAGLVSRNTAPFPFSLFQLGIGLPVLAILSWIQWRTRSLRWVWLAYGLLAGTVAYFTRVFYDNYLGGILIALLIAQFMDGPVGAGG